MKQALCALIAVLFSAALTVAEEESSITEDADQLYELVWTKDVEGESRSTMAISPDGRFLVTQVATNMHVFDVATGQETARMGSVPREINFSPNGTELFSTHGNAKVLQLYVQPFHRNGRLSKKPQPVPGMTYIPAYLAGFPATTSTVGPNKLQGEQVVLWRGQAIARLSGWDWNPPIATDRFLAMDHPDGTSTFVLDVQTGKSEFVQTGGTGMVAVAGNGLDLVHLRGVNGKTWVQPLTPAPAQQPFAINEQGWASSPSLLPGDLILWDTLHKERDFREREQFEVYSLTEDRTVQILQKFYGGAMNGLTAKAAVAATKDGQYLATRYTRAPTPPGTTMISVFRKKQDLKVAGQQKN